MLIVCGFTFAVWLVVPSFLLGNFEFCVEYTVLTYLKFTRIVKKLEIMSLCALRDLVITLSYHFPMILSFFRLAVVFRGVP